MQQYKCIKKEEWDKVLEQLLVSHTIFASTDSEFGIDYELVTPAVISRILSDGLADYVALCRPLIREPDLINRWKNGDLKRSKCISCNGCFDTAAEGTGVACKVERALKEKAKE